MENKVLYKTIRRFGTDIHVLEFKTNENLVATVCADDRGHREKLTDINHNWFEKQGFDKIGGTNLQFFSYSEEVDAVGLEYVDHGFTQSRVDSVGKGFYEAIYMDGKLIIEELVSQDEFDKKYKGKAMWGVSLSYTLVLDGKLDIRGDEYFDHSNQKHPRTLLGQKPSGELLMVVAEGRNSDDNGLTAEQSAEVMLELGADRAINADGGGSSTMQLGDEVVNFIAGGDERRIANALLIYGKDYEIVVEKDKSNLEKIDAKVEITAKYLNVRRFAGLDYPKVDLYHKGDIIEVDGQIDGWYKVKGKEHYFSGKDIFGKLIKDETKYETKQGRVHRATVLRVRYGPSTNYDVADRIDSGDIVNIIETDNTGKWYKIGSKRWVYAYYIKLVDDIEEEFRVMTTEELIDYCIEFNWTRKPKELQIHHTFIPNFDDFNGHNHQSLQKGMKNYHVNTNGWADIGQHLTLAPDGKWVMGRSFNKSPVSVSGRNYLGFAIEMIGNFDKGNDEFTNGQRESLFDFMNYMMDSFRIGYIFHRDHSYKTCPGSGIDRKEFNRLLKSSKYDEPNELITWFKNEFNLELTDDELSDIMVKLENYKK